MKKIILTTCALLTAAMTLTAASKKGTVRYLNLKPEVDLFMRNLQKFMKKRPV